MPRCHSAAFVLSAGLALGVAAQDSVSTDPLGAGAAIAPTDASRQITRFVVDLDTIESRTGLRYGVAPLLQTGTTTGSGTIRSARAGSHAISQCFRPATFATGPYALWTSPGFGVGPNTLAGAPQPLPGGSLSSFVVAASDRSGSRTSLLTGLVAFDPATRTRLFVDRIVAATTSPTAGSAPNATLSVGAVDASANLVARFDGFDATGVAPVTGNGVLRVNAELRASGLINDIDAGGFGDGAATELLFDPADATPPTSLLLAAPSLVPASGAGGSSVGGTIGDEVLFDDHSIATASMLVPDAAFVGLPTDASGLRGTVAVGPASGLGGVGTLAGVLANDAGQPVYVVAASADATGAPGDVAVFAAPAVLQDPSESYGPSGAPFGAFIGLTADRVFESSAGTVAVGVDAAGRVLVAGAFAIACESCESADGLATPVTFGAAPDTAPHAGLAVLRFDPADPVGTQVWSLAAWTNGDTGLGKTFANDQGATIGMLAPANARPGMVGPAYAGASIDSAGNLVFASSFIDFGPDTASGTADDSVRTGLFRAVYDPAAFGYTLELLLAEGDILAGQNSGRPYRIDMLGNSSFSGKGPGEFFGTGTTRAAYPGTAPSDPADPDSLGAAVVPAVITYDRNEDGTFDVNPGTQDETYAVLLVLTPLEQIPPITDCNGNGVDDPDDIATGTSQDINTDGVPDECQITRRCADTNNDGLVSPDDFTAWLAAYNANNYRADQNDTGTVTPADFTAWVANYTLGAAGPLCLE
ncbi:MAG: hypothetical protein ACTS22_06215 [Phycisphaerales bacterium]